MPFPPEPICCGEPMVHNSAADEYECAAAYFYLLDAMIVADFGRHLAVAEDHLNKFDAEQLRHWRASWAPDGWDAAEQGEGGAR